MHPIRKFKLSLSGLLLALVLASCSTPKDAVNYLDAPATVEHDSTSETAIVVIGIRTEDGTPFGGNPFAPNAILSLIWRELNLETGALVYDVAGLNDRGDFKTSRYTCFGHPACNYDDYTKIQYNLIKIRPGHYMLHRLMKQSTHITNMIPSERSLLQDDSPLALYKSGRVPAFEAKAGEVVYVGNYILEAMGEFARLVRVESNPEEAEQTLAFYPSVAGEMVVRVPEFER